DPLPALRRPPRARVPRRAAADGASLLPQLRIAEVLRRRRARARRLQVTPTTPRRRATGPVHALARVGRSVMTSLRLSTYHHRLSPILVAGLAFFIAMFLVASLAAAHVVQVTTTIDIADVKSPHEFERATSRRRCRWPSSPA